MQIHPNHDIWQRIYPNLRDEFFKSGNNYDNLEQFEFWLYQQGIKIYRDSTRSDGYLWQTIELPDNEELIALLIKWG